MPDRKYSDEELDAILGEPKGPAKADLDDINAILTTIADDVSEIHDNIKIITGCVVGLTIGLVVYMWKHNLL